MGLRISARALILAILAGACAWAGTIFGIFALYVFAVSLTSLLIIGIGTCAYGTKKSWRIVRRITPAPATVGDEVRISIAAEPTRVLAPTMLLHELTPKGNRQFGIANGLRSQRIEASWPGDARTRGLFEAGPGTLYRHDALRLFRRKIMDLPITSIVVHPRSVPIDPNVFADVLVHSSGQARDHGNAHGDLREYVPGDDPRRINWKISARTISAGQLMVTDSERVERDSTMSVELLLDSLLPSSTAQGALSHADREIALSVAASLLRAFTHAEPPIAHTFSIRRASHVVHTATDLQPNLDALALVESFESAPSESNQPSGRPSSQTLAAHVAIDEPDDSRRRATATVLITGSGADQTGIVTLRCGQQTAPEKKYDPADARFVRTIPTLNDLAHELDSLRESALHS